MDVNIYSGEFHVMSVPRIQMYIRTITLCLEKYDINHAWKKRFFSLPFTHTRSLLGFAVCGSTFLWL